MSQIDCFLTILIDDRDEGNLHTGSGDFLANPGGSIAGGGPERYPRAGLPESCGARNASPPTTHHPPPTTPTTPRPPFPTRPLRQGPILRYPKVPAMAARGWPWQVRTGHGWLYLAPDASALVGANHGQSYLAMANHGQAKDLTMTMAGHGRLSLAMAGYGRLWPAMAGHGAMAMAGHGARPV